jgi:hypothetical protein
LDGLIYFGGVEKMTKLERIERLLEELKYEVSVGMLQGEIDESLGFEFIVPQSKTLPGGVVRCLFQTRPIHYQLLGIDKPGLRIIK